jgi:hypothetical protein
MIIIEKIVDATNGEETIVEREETAEETANRLKSEERIVEAEAKAEAKAAAQAKLEALGLTVEDLQALGL